MSMLSKYIDRYISKKVKKHGRNGAILWAIKVIVKKTPTKTDDAMLAEVEKLIESFR
tara:strand:+ start:173 stop:343 length:171 start_codon:yes stop_codon:yes gene_type:complete